jgi:hypothetical protein
MKKQGWGGGYLVGDGWPFSIGCDKSSEHESGKKSDRKGGSHLRTTDAIHIAASNLI